MKTMILALTVAASPAPVLPALPMPSISFDGTQVNQIPQLSAMPLPPIPVPVFAAPAIAATPTEEFTRVPDWFDAGKLRIVAAIKAEGGGTVVMRYGWRTQYEMTVFAFPGSPSVLFTEYSSNPMGKPTQAFEATMNTPRARRAAANILREVNARKPVKDKDKEVYEAVLKYLEGSAS